MEFTFQDVKSEIENILSVVWDKHPYSVFASTMYFSQLLLDGYESKIDLTIDRGERGTVYYIIVEFVDDNYFLHRDEKPASLKWKVNTKDLATSLELLYYKRGTLHREDGPAVVKVDNQEGELTKAAFYLDGKEVGVEDLLPRLSDKDVKKKLIKWI